MNRAHGPMQTKSFAFADRLHHLFSSSAYDRRSVTRLLCVVAIVAFGALSVLVFRASEQKLTDRSAAQRAVAWQNTGRVSTSALGLDAFVASWSAQRAQSAAALTLSWRVRDARDLRASLLALDATKLGVQRIDVVRQDASYTVVAEVAP